MYSQVSKYFMRAKDAPKDTSQKLLSVILPLCLLGASSSLSASDSDEPEERWFEIEVILYKANSDSGLTNESWDTDTPFNLPEDLQDFLNPVAPEDLQESLSELTAEQEELQSVKNKTKLNLSAPEKANDNIANSTQLASGSDPEQIEPPLVSQERELPFQPLDKEYLQLQKEAKNISVHPSFRLLAHFAWRQPVAGKSTATRVRFAGGHDYSENFEFNGTKKLDLDSQELLSDPISGTQEVVQDNSSISELSQETTALNKNSSMPSLDSQTAPLSEQNTAALGEELLVNTQPILLPWVPEIDGSAKVYIYRNYLHLDADLVFRKPGQLEVDIYSLESPLNFEDEPLVAPITPMTDELSSFENTTQKDNQQQVFESNNESDKFAWQFDSDFLSQDSEKVYTEKLFNYPLKQTRRMRSTELHYFDHPKIGMLVIIRPYELETDDEESIND